MAITLENLGAVPIDLKIGTVELHLYPMSLSDIIKIRLRIREDRIKIAKLGASNAQERIEISVACSKEEVTRLDEINYLNSHEGTRYLLYLLNRDGKVSEEVLGDSITSKNLKEINDLLSGLLGAKEDAPSDPPETPSV